MYYKNLGRNSKLFLVQNWCDVIDEGIHAVLQFLTVTKNKESEAEQVGL